MSSIPAGISFMFLIYGAIILVSVVVIIFLIIHRINVKKKEDFEKRNN